LVLFLHSLFPLSLSILPLPPRSTLFPYTTLFRSFRLHRFDRLDLFPDSHQPHFARLRHLAAGDRDARSGFPTPLGSTSPARALRSEEHTSELQSRENLVCRLLLEKKKKKKKIKKA